MHVNQKIPVPIVFFGLLLLAAVFGTGCNSSPQLKGLVPVKGTVTYQGKPLEGATVVFSPKENKQGRRAAVALTDKQGKFELMTLSQKGAFPGEYLASVVKNADAAPKSNQERIEQIKQKKPLQQRPQNIVSEIPVKYNDEKKSGLFFDIGEKGLSNVKIVLEE
ncbi:MAG: carboxypeptidase-like regulatory domain-containing protein [Planctomycetaceae bacterium]|nr:carboxypeptidase-like regulatory domain-containing protein [Planctomycetaceae bacterium]